MLWLLRMPLVLGFLALVWAAPAAGILLETGNVNASAPPEPPGDPGFDYVARLTGLNGVYVGYGWVLTAGHVGVPPGSTFWTGGVPYPVISPSRIVFQHQPGSLADLAAVRIDPYPSHLEPLEIIEATPPIGAEVLLVGAGADRTNPVDWIYDGWQWGGVNGIKRWGTNHVGGDVAGLPGTTGSWPFASGAGITQSVVTQFDESGSDHEGTATIGDSGGALFARAHPAEPWRLAGIQWAITLHAGQPYHTSVYGNDTLSVDLGFYRQKVLAVVRPCLDGVDNDGDTLVDFPDDPDCLWEGDMSELPACADGIDNDWDGGIDLADAGCASAADPLEEPDLDADLVADGRDNCQDILNANQRDTNADGYGNACDADASNDGVVGGPDFSMMFGAFGSQEGSPGYDPDLDFGGDGAVGGPDFFVMMSHSGMAPGPSGLTCAGQPPCP